MKTYLVTIDTKDENKLKKYCTITDKLTLLNGLYIVKSDYDEDYLNKLDFIKNIECDDKYFGTINV
jgi:hypothetical protein